MPCWCKTIMVLALMAAGCRDIGSDNVDTSNNDALTSTSGGKDTGLESSGDDGDVSEVTYANFGDGFIRNWCRGCHSSLLDEIDRNGAPLGVDFNTLEAVREYADRILARATGDEPTMPPVDGPSDEERELLRNWLESGAP